MKLCWCTVNYHYLFGCLLYIVAYCSFHNSLWEKGFLLQLDVSIVSIHNMYYIIYIHVFMKAYSLIALNCPMKRKLGKWTKFRNIRCKIIIDICSKQNDNLADHYMLQAVENWFETKCESTIHSYNTYIYIQKAIIRRRNARRCWFN